MNGYRLNLKDVEYQTNAMLAKLGLAWYEAKILRHAARALHRWAEGECGTDRWCISRDEETGKPFREYSGGGKEPIRDLEKAALGKVAKVCEFHKLHFYHQGDPRGCVLYVAREPLTDQNYNNGVAVI